MISPITSLSPLNESLNPLSERPIAIIGAGPVGLFTIFECGLLGMKCYVFDSLDAAGGQCQALYPDKPIYDIPAHPHINGGELIDQLLAQAAPFDPIYHLGQTVNELTARDGERPSFHLRTSKGVSVEVSAIIIAAGGGAFGPHRPPLDNIELYEGKSIFYAVRQPQQFAGKRIVIAGGGDSALDWAIALQPIAAHITLIHRRAKFRGAPHTLSQINQLAAHSKIDICTPYQLSELAGTDGQLEMIWIADLDGQRKAIEADILLPFFGLSMHLGPIAEWGLNLNRHHIIVEPLTGRTSIPGIYGVGDIVTYPHKRKLIVTGFAEAAQVAHQIQEDLHPGQVFHFEYSTTKGIPALSTPLKAA